MPVHTMRAIAPTDDLINDHAARVSYDMKQQQEEIPAFKPRMQIGDIGGCASIGAEVFTKGGTFQYCRNPRRCKAAMTAAKMHNRKTTESQAKSDV